MSCSALASLQLGLVARPALGVCQRSGMNSFKRISTQRRPNSGNKRGKPVREGRILTIPPQGRAPKACRCAADSCMPGCSRKSAVSFTGSSQPKYSKSRKTSDPSAAESVVEAEIGRHQTPAALRQRLVEIEASGADSSLACPSKLCSAGAKSRSRNPAAKALAGNLEAGAQASPNLTLDLRAGQAGLRCRGHERHRAGS